MRQVGLSVGHPTYIEDFCSCAGPISGPHLKRNRVRVGSGLVRLEAVSIAQYQGRIQASFDRSYRGVHHGPSRILSCSHSTTGDFIPASAGGGLIHVR
jgi:hypothetical protein